MYCTCAVTRILSGTGPAMSIRGARNGHDWFEVGSTRTPKESTRSVSSNQRGLESKMTTVIIVSTAKLLTVAGGVVALAELIDNCGYL